MNYRTIVSAANLKLESVSPGHAHNRAFDRPVAFEAPIVAVLNALADMATNHERRYESKIGDDGVLGECWLDMARGLRGMLNGETGRLDCGTIDAAICNLALAAGFEGEL